MQKIILITCYFGEFPWYFNLFLKSCEHNPTVDFLIFSDCSIPKKLPQNVKIKTFTIQEFNSLATEKLNFNINVESAYKFCDFKPAYGVIFSEYIKSYGFWGITDIDIVFGRIREFMTDDLLNQYDIISARNDYPTGSFMLFRNKTRINNLFKKSKDYKKVFTSEIHYCFDECNFKHLFLQEGGDIFDTDCEIESMHHVIKKEERENNLRAYFDFLIIEGLPGQLKWDNGVLSFMNEFEVLFHHLILYKSHRYTVKRKWKNVPDVFFIDKYWIRRNKLSSIKGFLMSVMYNHINPKLNQGLFLLDHYLSCIFNLKIKELKANRYQSNHELITINFLSNENSISFNDDGINEKIVKSVLSRNTFCLSSDSFLKYSLNENSGKLTELHRDGLTQTFKLM